MDDGADVIGVLHSARREQLGDIIAGTEETTTGVIRLKALEAEGKLGFPIIAVNEAMTKHMFDNRYGTGQSTIDGIIRATNVLLAGKKFVIGGYGWVGRGVASRARGMGAHVIITEVDPMKALEAVMDGFEVHDDGAGRQDRRHLLHRHRRQERDRARALRADEGRCDPLRTRATSTSRSRSRRCGSSRRRRGWRASSSRSSRWPTAAASTSIADGRLVNLAAAEGHPALVMDMSFANQALGIEYAVQHASELERKVYPVPAAIDKEIARLKLATMGIEIDVLTEEQAKYLASWDEGT